MKIAPTLIGAISLVGKSLFLRLLLLLAAIAALAAALAELAGAPDDDQYRPDDAEDRAGDPAQVVKEERETDQDDGDRADDMMAALARAACLGSFVRIHDV